MSFDNHYYPNRKDKIKPYYHSGKHDRSCRPHGGCPYCRGGRLHNRVKSELGASEKLKEYNSN